LALVMGSTPVNRAKYIPTGTPPFAGSRTTHELETLLMMIAPSLGVGRS
jgi:hypothetical protein